VLVISIWSSAEIRLFIHLFLDVYIRFPNGLGFRKSMSMRSEIFSAIKPRWYEVKF